MALPRLSEPLVERVNVGTLYPISSAKVQEAEGHFSERLFDKDFEPDDGKNKLSDLMRASSFPGIFGTDVH